jgi:hypothetical protein
VCDLDKSKQFQRTGPVAISNTKHMYADMEIRVEDAQVSQKHVNLFQPVLFYTSDDGRPVELASRQYSQEPHSRLHQRAQIQRCRTDGADISECTEHTAKAGSTSIKTNAHGLSLSAGSRGAYLVNG